ncbi:MAG: S-adenosylmethionine decarboxylase [Acidobacteria bacterium]|nr:S-adenosylmethionine decarboxylase [Acidobacteriota bacterium]
MKAPMIVGTEWLIEAKKCDEETLRSEQALRDIFALVIRDLGLTTLGKDVWHKFPGEGGVTGLVALTESHLACHTYPEYGIATFNLYCCKTRPEWDWEEKLLEKLGAEEVSVTRIERGAESSAGVPPAVKNASRVRKDFPEVRYGEITRRDRGKLPHLEKENGIYFVTFRLADSLPKNVINQFKIERNEILRVLDKTEREPSRAEKKRIDKLFSDKIEEYLDSGYGSCILRNEAIAKTVADAFDQFDRERYDIFSWCVMPNHVHVVFRPLNNNKLEDILHSWKSFTSHKINEILNRQGTVWQREYYDHLVRDQKDFDRVNKYVLDNPKKANLFDWQWCSERLRPGRPQDSRRDAGATMTIGGEA